MFRWLKGKGAPRSEVARLQARIDPAMWRAACTSLPFVAALTLDELEQLHGKTAWVLASKTMNAARGEPLTDHIRLMIAAQAALPILHLPHALYEGWDEIIVYPSGFAIPRREADDFGVVHEFTEEAAGEAWDGGPVVLSWEDARPQDGAFNVVIHEFAHKIDLHGGGAPGIPDLGSHPDLSSAAWARVLDHSYETFCRELDDVQAAIPEDVDPESEQADAWWSRLPMDAYAATDEAEFFAVSTESFFVDPLPMSRMLPQWYALLEAYYRQDTLVRWQRAGAPSGDR